MSVKGGAALEWEIAGQPLPGQSESGDLGLVLSHQDGALLAVIDGVGHGEEAAAAARTAAGVLKRQPDAPVIWLVRECHRALLDTRGVVMSLASYSARYGTLTWIGVGNVEGLLWRADPSASPVRETLLLRGGGVGFSLPQLSASVIPVSRGDTLVFATDGVRSDFATRLTRLERPEVLATQILSQDAKGTDDALVLAALLLAEAGGRG